VSLRYYQRAVNNGMELRRHRDYDEVLAATRFPSFITQRDKAPADKNKPSRPLPEDNNWQRLDRAARAAARGHGTPVTQVTTAGTARMVTVGSSDEDPGTQNWNNPGANPQFPESYKAGVVPWGGRRLADAAHRGHHGEPYGAGEGDGALAEDHGVVRSTYTLNNGQVLRHTTFLEAGRNGVWADPHDFDLPEGSKRAHSHHIFHGDLMRVAGHGQRLGTCEGPGCEQGLHRGLYRGHMRYRLADEDALWNMPRTLTLITRPTHEEKRMAWDFDFHAELPGPVHFSTWDAPGDAASGNSMAALASGLVYFHKPRLRGAGTDEEYVEPPNQWNPFWRAKLHPVWQRDAITATAGGVHDATHRVLTDLHRWNAVNY
jgi:hypothetical protein